MLLNISRRLHTSCTLWASETNMLAKLRKKTGYAISNCKKALEMHDNDIIKAETWLNSQALEMGWSKATKLAGRATAQGLVAVRYDRYKGALIEINCETDFVAKNEKFLAMIEDAANACYQFADTNLTSDDPISKLLLDTERLGSLQSSDGKFLKDKLALLIGSVGENAILKRAQCWKSNSDDVLIAGYAHPNVSNIASDFQSGKYSALVAFKVKEEQNEYVGKEICQHIVGMNPEKIGNAEVDKPATNADDEDCLIYQEYILDPESSVKEVLDETGVEVVDYIRYACGEQDDDTSPNQDENVLEARKETN